VASGFDPGRDKIEAKQLSDGRIELYYVDVHYTYNSRPQFIGYLDPEKKEVIRPGFGTVPFEAVKNEVDGIFTADDGWDAWFAKNKNNGSADQRSMWADPTLNPAGTAYDSNYRSRIATAERHSKWLAEQSVQFTATGPLSAGASNPAAAGIWANGERSFESGMRAPLLPGAEARSTGGLGKFPEWKVGDPISKVTPEGNYPSWQTIRERYRQNRAGSAAPGEFGASNMGAMRQGAAPSARVLVRDNATGQTREIRAVKELHHARGGRGVPGHDSPVDLRELWPWEHSAIDPSRRLDYTFIGFK
jgi:hypothetical protein